MPRRAAGTPPVGAVAMRGERCRPRLGEPRGVTGGSGLSGGFMGGGKGGAGAPGPAVYGRPPPSLGVFCGGVWGGGAGDSQVFDVVVVDGPPRTPTS